MMGMPDIPDYKGIVSSGADALISFGGAFLIKSIFGNYWGIFTEFGIPLLLADSVIEFEENHASRIAKLPIEKGSFASYNKVNDPSSITMVFTKGSGGSTERGLFLMELEILRKSQVKVYVITPEKVYRNMNVVGVSQKRSADDGARLMKVAVTLEEVREVKVDLSSSESKDAENTDTVDAGDV